MGTRSVKKKIGVIGQGFVGGALTQIMSRHYDVMTFDKAGVVAQGGVIPDFSPGPRVWRPVESVTELVTVCEADGLFTGITFVCLPTPMKRSGECDVSIVESVLDEMSIAPLGRCEQRIAVVKSTVPPGTCERWNEKYEKTNLRVVFNPEFLTEANSVSDFEHQNRIIVGGPRPSTDIVKRLFEEIFKDIPIVKTSSTIAEMVKYYTNVQLAARVILSCELAQICERAGIDYDKVKEYAMFDPRLGGTHMNVPGSDGVPGARGHCFPKDMQALAALARKLGAPTTVLDALWQKNMDIVPPEHRDWERMKGRAVVD